MDKNISRREGRYMRRKQKRYEKLLLRNQKIGSLENIYNYKDLYISGKKCCKNVRWKASTQNFEIHIFSGTAKRRKQVLSKKWKPDKYNHFILHERGKIRPIDAPRIQDRQVHKLFTTQVLLPLYIPGMIYNNGASLPGKGFDFTRCQLCQDLREHYRKYGREGKIILLDFKQFFPSVSHQKLYERHDQIILDKQLCNFADEIVASVGRPIGLPLGVEPSQAEMIAFPSPIDNYIKCQLSLKGMGHYMDDYYILVPPDRNAKEILNLVLAKIKQLKLTVSPSKTRIYSLIKPFKFCKLKYHLTISGRVIVNGCRGSMIRAKRKFKTFQLKVSERKMNYLELWASVNGIMAYFKKYNDHNRILKLRRLFYYLFDFSCESMKKFQYKQRQLDEIYCT